MVADGYSSFNSLQTGRCIQSTKPVGHMKRQINSFNSLQTGRCIQSIPCRSRGFYQRSVSIPFKREGVSKACQQCRPSAPGKSFNSLQTGRCIQRNLPQQLQRVPLYSFNSLQTGRCIQRDPILSPVGPWLQNAKTKREVREAFFSRKITPKTAQTRINTKPNAIFS